MLGLDLSCTSTGLVVLGVDNGRPVVLLECRIQPKKLVGFERCDFIAKAVIGAACTWKPRGVAIEGYGGQFKSSLIPLVEVGTVVRMALRRHGFEWFDVAPKELKSFVAGNGNADKERMVAAVTARWDHTPANNDTADAFGLGCIALGRAGKLTGMTDSMLSVCVSRRVQ